MTSPEPYDLFISYAPPNREWVYGYLVDTLERANVSYLLEDRFTLGAPQLLELERAVKQSQRVLLVISAAYLLDSATQFLDLLAQNYGLQTATWKVIPLLLEPVDLPERLRILVALDATDADRQAKAMQVLLEQLQRPIPALPPQPACPYPGMQPFQEEDGDRFFGRDAQIQLLINRYLRHYPFVAVIGRSGSGKSSLVQAGLIPALRNSQLFGAGDWLVHTVRPGETPLTTLEATVGIRAADLATTISDALAHANASRLLLVVDQFEEVFTRAQQQQAAFQLALLDLIEIPNCYLVLTVRADFYADLMNSLLWDQIKDHQCGIVGLNRAELAEAIAEPARNAGVWIDSRLVERLVKDAAGAEEPGILPFLQETLVLLWQRLERRYLPLQAYEQFETVSLASQRRETGLTGLQAAISYRADSALAQLTDPQKAIARRIFLRLVQFGEGRPDVRRQQPVAALRSSQDPPALFDQTLAHCAAARLLTLDRRETDAQSTVDLAHEVMISSWSTLQQWLQERRQAEQERRRLEEKATDWQQRGRGNRGLLDPDELAEAKRWLKHSDAQELGSSEALSALVRKSQSAIYRLRSTLAALIIAALAFGGFAWNRQQQSEQDQLIRDAVLNVTTPNLVQRLSQRLPAYVKTADQARASGAVEQAIASYQFLVALKRLEPKIAAASNAEDFASLTPERQTIQAIATTAEASLAAVIQEQRLPRLADELQQRQIGDVRLLQSNPPEYASIAELENQFTPGALRTTYEILMRQTGANADLNNDGILTEGEELLLPCDTLEAIETLWRRFTAGRCGWYGESDVYIAPDCQELGGRSLLAKLIFPASVPLVEQRLGEQCQVVSVPKAIQ